MRHYPNEHRTGHVTGVGGAMNMFQWIFAQFPRIFLPNGREPDSIKPSLNLFNMRKTNAYRPTIRRYHHNRCLYDCYSPQVEHNDLGGTGSFEPPGLWPQGGQLRRRK
jgi:hypothetical protein